MGIQILEGEHYASSQSGRVWRQIAYVRQYTIEMQPITTGQDTMSRYVKKVAEMEVSQPKPSWISNLCSWTT